MTANQTLESRFLALLREEGGSITLDGSYDVIDLAYDLDCQIDELNAVFGRLLYEHKINVTIKEAGK